MIFVSRGAAFGCCGDPNATGGGERRSPQPRLYKGHCWHDLQAKSSGLLPPLERSPVPGDLFETVAPQLVHSGHEFGVSLSPLGLELVVMLRLPGRSPRGAAAPRGSAVGAVVPWPASTAIDDLSAACRARFRGHPISNPSPSGGSTFAQLVPPVTSGGCPCVGVTSRPCPPGGDRRPGTRTPTTVP
jgi:hypothetical protein